MKLIDETPVFGEGNSIVRKLKFRTAVGVSALALGLAGCASIPADHNVLVQRDLSSMQLASDIKLAHDGWPEAQWWTRYGDAQLDGLIKRALAGSPTLDVAAARFGSARAALAVSGAAQGVDVNLNAAANRQRYSATGLFPAPIGGSYYSETTIQIQAHYDFDWWGKNRAQIAASLGEVYARRAEYAQAEQVLAAAITQSYFTLQGGWARLANLQQCIAAQHELLEDRTKLVAHGMASIDAQRVAEQDLSMLNKQRAQVDTQIEGEREALRALLGADSAALADLKPNPIPDLPHTLPSTLGMELLARRADLQAAHWRVEASLSRIEAAQAAYYPDVNLTGSFGLDSIGISNLFSAASRTPYIGPTLSLPLFDSKRLDAQLGAARTQRNELIAEYNQMVFNAVRDVAQEGVALRGIEDQINQQGSAIQASHDLLQSAQEKLDHGLANRGTVLSAELALLKQQDAKLQLENQQLITEVALFKALGGGYRLDVTSLPAKSTPTSSTEAAALSSK